MLEILVGQIPEAIYFALFMIFVKTLREKRILFIALTILEYILLLHSFPYSVWSHIGFFVITYIILKLLYKEKSQITDIFTLGIASILMIAINCPLYFIVWLFTDEYMVYVVLTRLVLFILLFMFRHKLNYIQKIYKHLWNRNDKLNRIMKSTTFRSANLVVFNIMFYLINFGMLYALFLGGD